MTKYKYFIPLIGMFLLIYDTYSTEETYLSIYYGELLELILMFYCFIIHIPLFLFIAFLIIN